MNRLILKYLTIRFAWPWLFKNLLSGYVGMTFFIFQIYKSKERMRFTTVNHEDIHTLQQWEMLFVFNWLAYSLNYLYLRIELDARQAYRSVIFEREAYYNEASKSYPIHRPFWNWTQYL